MKITVVDLGKIGLPVAVQFANRGHETLGAYVDAGTLAFINCRQEQFPSTAHPREKLADSDAVVVVEPLSVGGDGRPDFYWMDSATKDISPELKPGSLLAHESTLPVGTTRTRWKLLREEGSRLAEGRDLPFAFSLERFLTDRVLAGFHKFPRLFGALSKEDTILATWFYGDVLKFDERSALERGDGVRNHRRPVETAEIAKFAENTYRGVNIVLADQFGGIEAKTRIGVDKLIEAGNSQPDSRMHLPGSAVGCQCSPGYPGPVTGMSRTRRSFVRTLWPPRRCLPAAETWPSETIAKSSARGGPG